MINDLIEGWQVYVKSQNQWEENRHQGYRVTSIDTTGLWRPKLQGWVGNHYHSIAGRALPAVILGVMTVSSQIQGKRIPLLKRIIRCSAKQNKAEFRVELLKETAKWHLPDEANTLDRRFKLSEIHEAELSNYVVRLQSNCTARRTKLPEYKGAGTRPKYGEINRLPELSLLAGSILTHNEWLNSNRCGESAQGTAKLASKFAIHTVNSVGTSKTAPIAPVLPMVQSISDRFKQSTADIGG
ncbi:MAG: hypothetical protein KDD92_02095 [Caldilineaceae bacterium]|nr:hypothetical protein [Caldilineaceae bacterium]